MKIIDFMANLHSNRQASFPKQRCSWSRLRSYEYGPPSITTALFLARAENLSAQSLPGFAPNCSTPKQFASWKPVFDQIAGGAQLGPELIRHPDRVDLLKGGQEKAIQAAAIGAMLGLAAGLRQCWRSRTERKS